MSVLRAFLLPLVLFSVGAFALSGCVVEERTAVRRSPCPGGYWVEGHYGPYGHWHPGHWRCPGVVEVVEVR